MRRSTSNTSRKRTGGTATKTLNVVNNFICFLFAATAFAMIGIEASGHHGSNHSGTQEFIKLMKREYVCTFDSIELDLLYEVVRQVRNEHAPNWQPEEGSWGHAICQLDIKLTELFHKRRQ